MKKEQNRKKEEMNLIIIFLVSFVFLNLIGYLFNINTLKLFVHNGSNRTIYFVSVYISVFVSIIYYIIKCIINKRNKKQITS